MGWGRLKFYQWQWPFVTWSHTHAMIEIRFICLPGCPRRQPCCSDWASDCLIVFGSDWHWVGLYLIVFWDKAPGKSTISSSMHCTWWQIKKPQPQSLTTAGSSTPHTICQQHLQYTVQILCHPKPCGICIRPLQLHPLQVCRAAWWLQHHRPLCDHRLFHQMLYIKIDTTLAIIFVSKAQHVCINELYVSTVCKQTPVRLWKNSDTWRSQVRF